MTSIQGYTELLTLGAGGPLDKAQREFAEVILRNVERMDRYVDSLLELSRIESGRIELSPRPTQLATVVRDALESVNGEVERHRIEIVINIPDLLPEVHIDPARIKQAWVNLLTHTCHITSDGGQIKVWAQPHRSPQVRPEGKQWVLCAVQAQAYQSAIQALDSPLQAFDRANEASVLNEQANGLDVSIARGIIELHGGQTWVNNAVDGAGAFCFTLPGSSTR
jgi:signal transduction histidine kinase